MLFNGNLRPERLDLGPKRLDLRLERLDLRPERLDLRPERPDLRPERPDLRPEGSEGGGDARTNERTNGRTKVPLCSTGLRPLRGRCPKKQKNAYFPLNDMEKLMKNENNVKFPLNNIKN